MTGGSGFIGVHLVANLLERRHKVVNLDINPPIDNLHLENWVNESVLNFYELEKLHESHQFTDIVHLAAVAIQDANSLDDFEVNLKGTRNIIEICNKYPEISKVIFTSTQYVNLPGLNPPVKLDDYVPFGYYGKSKLIGELDVHDDLKNTNWTIIRPTAIWGCFHPVLVDGLWFQIYKGRYLHPSRDHAVKPYGYVKNTVWQIAEILDIHPNETKFKTFYLADSLLSQKIWVQAFVDSLGARYREVPRLLLFLLSKFGDLMKSVNLNFPLYSSRYNNLIRSNPIEISPIVKLLGKPPFEFEDGVSEVRKWLKDEKWSSGKPDV